MRSMNIVLTLLTASLIGIVCAEEEMAQRHRNSIVTSADIEASQEIYNESGDKKIQLHLSPRHQKTNDDKIERSAQTSLEKIDEQRDLLQRFYQSFTDSSLQVIYNVYIPHSEAYSYAMADYEFLKAYRQFGDALRRYSEYTCQDYEIATKEDPAQENPMRFLNRRKLELLGNDRYRIIMPSGMSLIVAVDNEGLFDILECELPAPKEKYMFQELAEWTQKWEYGARLLETFPTMSLYEIRRNISTKARNAIICFSPRKQNGRYLVRATKRYCIFANEKRERSVTGYNSVCVDVFYQPVENNYELKVDVLYAEPAIESDSFLYDAKTGELLSDKPDYIAKWVIFMLHYSNLPTEGVTQGQCWTIEDTRYELVAAGMAGGALLAQVKSVNVLSDNSGYIEGSFLFDLEKGKFISGKYRFLKTTNKQDTLFETIIYSLDDQ